MNFCKALDKSASKNKTEFELWNGGDIRVAKKNMNFSCNKVNYFLELRVEAKVSSPKSEVVGYVKSDVKKEITMVFYKTKGHWCGTVNPFNNIPQMNEAFGIENIQEAEVFLDEVSKMKQLVAFNEETLKKRSDSRKNAIRQFAKDFCYTLNE